MIIKNLQGVIWPGPPTFSMAACGTGAEYRALKEALQTGIWVEKKYPDLNKKTPEEIGADALAAINDANSVEEAMVACREHSAKYFDAVNEEAGL